MKLLHTIATASLTLHVTAQRAINATSYPNATDCVSGAHVIVARASLEAPGYGTLGSLKDQILSRIPNSNAIAVPYPATIYGDIVYIDSEPQGVGNLSLLVRAYADACPGRPMVLMGYSQGAHVVGDALIGSNYTAFPAFPNTTGLAQRYIDSIAAVVLMGDPANVAGQPFSKGNSTHSGVFPRNNTAKWASTGLTNKIVSYCDANDTFCDSGSSIPVHLAYVGKYGSQAADFVVQKFTASNTSTATTSSPTSGATRLNFGPTTYLMAGALHCVLAFAMAISI